MENILRRISDIKPLFDYARRGAKTFSPRLNVFLRNDPHWTLAEQLRGGEGKAVVRYPSTLTA